MKIYRRLYREYRFQKIHRSRQGEIEILKAIKLHSPTLKTSANLTKEYTKVIEQGKKSDRRQNVAIRDKHRRVEGRDIRNGESR